MFSSDDFETALKEVITAKRLSASKMNSLTEAVMKNVEHDTQLVSILYRTHKSLSSAATKISSLYVFDALSRAARSHATKHGLSGDAFTQPGNSASFLFKIGGVVEGLFQDMIATGSSEAKEKTQKILDIWEKGSTFPADVISQLKLIVKGVEKVPNPTPMSVTDPRISNISPPVPVQSPPAPNPTYNATLGTVDPQATLLALLTQAAASITPPAAPPIATNVGSPVPQLDPAQLALLQQLAQTASVPSASQSLPFAESVNVQKYPSSSGFNDSSHTMHSFRNEPRTLVTNEQRYNGYRSPESERRLDSHFDERDNMRGRYRGGFRSSGRVDRFQGRNWDDRDRDRHRDPEKDLSPLRKGRGGRSRSRSPPSRYGGRRESHYFSPTGRNHGHSGQRNVSREPEAGKDEFGRDIRPASPEPSKDDNARYSSKSTASTQPQSSISPRSPTLKTSNIDSIDDHEIVPPSPSTNKTPSNNPDTTPTKDLDPEGVGMEAFDPSSFDFTSPASWEALGKMWQITYGFLPSTGQLMEFIASGFAQPDTSVATSTHYDSDPSFNPIYRGRGRGRGGHFSKGRGGNTHGNARTLYDDDWQDDNTHTDAVVLGGGDSPPNINTARFSSQPMQDSGKPISPDLNSVSNAGGGRMQKVGDKWVFVRGVAMDVA